MTRHACSEFQSCSLVVCAHTTNLCPCGLQYVLSLHDGVECDSGAGTRGDRAAQWPDGRSVRPHTDESCRAQSVLGRTFNGRVPSTLIAETSVSGAK